MANITLLKLHRPVSEAQEVWIKPALVTHFYEGTDEVEIYFVGGGSVAVVEAAQEVSQAICNGRSVIENEDDS